MDAKAREDAWATSQVQQGMAVLLAEQAAEEQREAYREWLIGASKRRLADAESHKRFADFMRNHGDISGFNHWTREARRALAMSEHYARKAETV